RYLAALDCLTDTGVDLPDLVAGIGSQHKLVKDSEDLGKSCFGILRSRHGAAIGGTGTASEDRCGKQQCRANKRCAKAGPVGTGSLRTCDKHSCGGWSCRCHSCSRGPGRAGVCRAIKIIQNEPHQSAVTIWRNTSAPSMLTII